MKFVIQDPNKGNHNASSMFFADVIYTVDNKEKSSNMVLKTNQQDGKKNEAFKDSFIFETESKVYSKVIPEFEGLLRKYGDQTKIKTCFIHWNREKK